MHLHPPQYSYDFIRIFSSIAIHLLHEELLSSSLIIFFYFLFKIFLYIHLLSYINIVSISFSRISSPSLQHHHALPCLFSSIVVFSIVFSVFSTASFIIIFFYFLFSLLLSILLFCFIVFFVCYLFQLLSLLPFYFIVIVLYFFFHLLLAFFLSVS